MTTAQLTPFSLQPCSACRLNQWAIFQRHHWGAVASGRASQTVKEMLHLNLAAQNTTATGSMSRPRQDNASRAEEVEAGGPTRLKSKPTSK